MNKKRSILGLVILISFLCAGCASNKDSNEIKIGTYIEESQGFSRVDLEDGNQFFLTLHPLSSYLPNGTYTLKEDKLILTENESQKTYKFKIDGDKLILDTGINTGIKTGFEGKGGSYILKKGMVFSHSEKLN